MNKVLFTIGAVLAVLATFFITSNIKDRQLEAQKQELRKEILRNDSLVKINDELYSKRVADTATIRQLKRLNDSLNLELKNPKVIVITKLQPKDQEGPIDSVDVSNDLVTVEDHYPDQDNPFVSYFGRIDLTTKSGEGTFKFRELHLDLGITQNNDGTYSLNTKVPDFMVVNSVDVTSLPMDTEKPDNFGWLLGVKGNYSFEDQNVGYEIIGGIRYKKVNIITSANTHKQVGAGLIFEF